MTAKILARPAPGGSSGPTAPPWVSAALRATTEVLRAQIPERFEVAAEAPWLRNTPERPVVRVVDRQTEAHVALTVATGLEQPEAVAQRMQALIGLEEPGLERIHDVIVNGRTLLYTAEIVEGPDLLDLEPPDIPAPLDLARAVASALVALHQRDWIHGNVRPASIRVVDRGRIVLIEPVLVPGPAADAAVDWRQLGGLLQYQIERMDSPLGLFAEELRQGRLDDLGVMRRLLALHAEGTQGRRYQHLGTLGIGGMGEVFRVRDPSLDRVVAQKVIRQEKCSTDNVRRFLAEARLTSQLQHPGIAPVHEVGTLDDGRPYFTMKVIDDRTLSRAIEAAREPDGAARGWTLRRLIEALRDAADAVAYAHARGVIHRDLKPDNILLGAFGEVLVGDWGLAKVLDGGEAFLSQEITEKGLTRVGRAIGTEGYMPPEQACGDVARHDRTSDVYALGATLFHVLTGESPPAVVASETCAPGASGTAEASGTSTSAGVHRSRPDALDQPGLPEELVASCRRAMAFEQAERHPDAAVFARALGDWLDGSLQRSRALARIPDIDRLAEEVSALRAEAVAFRREATARLDGVAPHDPLAHKLPGWTLEDRAAERDRQADARHAEYVRAIHTALELSPGLPEAERRLYDDYRDALLSAEARDDAPAVARYERLLADDPTGRHAAWLRGDGRVTLVTEPAGAVVTLRRFVPQQRRLVLGEGTVLSTTPLQAVPIARGSWVLELTHPECETVHYPIAIGRGEHWDGIPPGETAPATLVMPQRGQLRDGACYVPAGWFRAGGDPLAPDGLFERRLWVPGLLMQRDPVTHAAYVDFLNALVDRGEAARALRFAPREAASEGPILYHQGADGRFVLEAAYEGIVWQPDWPVVLIDAEGAEAYAAWWAERTELPWRLPHDHEWEKAARGVDGRAFPWGSYLDPTFACMLQSHKDTPTRAPVTAYPHDESPYGVRGLGGNVRDLCANGYRRAGLDPALQRVLPERRAPGDTFHVVRGGSWGSVETWCRSAARFAARPADRSTSVGFRLCCHWPAAP